MTVVENFCSRAQGAEKLALNVSSVSWRVGMRGQTNFSWPNTSFGAHAGLEIAAADAKARGRSLKQKKGGRGNALKHHGKAL